MVWDAPSSNQVEEVTPRFGSRKQAAPVKYFSKSDSAISFKFWDLIYRDIVLNALRYRSDTEFKDADARIKRIHNSIEIGMNTGGYTETAHEPQRVLTMLLGFIEDFHSTKRCDNDVLRVVSCLVQDMQGTEHIKSIDFFGICNRCMIVGAILM